MHAYVVTYQEMINMVRMKESWDYKSMKKGQRLSRYYARKKMKQAQEPLKDQQTKQVELTSIEKIHKS